MEEGSADVTTVTTGSQAVSVAHSALPRCPFRHPNVPLLHPQLFQSSDPPVCAMHQSHDLCQGADGRRGVDCVHQLTLVSPNTWPLSASSFIGPHIPWKNDLYPGTLSQEQDTNSQLVPNPKHCWSGGFRLLLSPYGCHYLRMN